MSHDHDHSHTPTISVQNERKILIAFCLIFSYMFVEIAAGVLSGSLALVADAGHMFTDAIALALAYFGFRLGKRSPDENRTFGYLRLEVLAAFINALLMFLIVLWILYEAWKRLASPPEIFTIPMFFAAFIGLIVNLVVFRILTQGDTDHVNIRGAILHVLGDLLGSIGACLAAVLIYLTGWTPIDLILSIGVALMILPSAWRLLKESTHILLEGAPANASADAMTTHLYKTVSNLEKITRLNVWMLSSSHTVAILHVRPKNFGHEAQLVHQIEHELNEHFAITNITIAIDWAANSHCPLELSAQ